MGGGGGGIPAGYGTALIIANRHLCDALSPLASQQSGAGNYDALNDVRQQIQDRFRLDLLDDQDGSAGNADDLDGRSNAGDRAPIDDDFE